MSRVVDIRLANLGIKFPSVIKAAYVNGVEDSHLLWRLRFEARLDRAAEYAMSQYRAYTVMLTHTVPPNHPARDMVIKAYHEHGIAHIRNIINGKAGVI